MAMRAALISGVSWRRGVITTLLLASACAFGEQRAAKMVELSGKQLRASAVALEDFSTKGFSLDHYVVRIEELPNGFEVVFVPDHPVGVPTSRGGGTVFGKEVRYTISNGGQIEAISYAR